MVKERDFIENKKQTLNKLDKAEKQGLVDKEIIPILDIINSLDGFYTTSSCYGRIILLEIPSIGDKKNADFLGRWHRQIEKGELLNAFASSKKKGQLWLLAQSPIIHIVAKSEQLADKIIKIAYKSGLKNSGFKSIDKNIIVEVCSTERLDAPIGKDGTLFNDDDFLQFLINIANDVMFKSAGKLLRFKQNLRQMIK